MSDHDKPNILVLDANQRSALAVTRSLGKSRAVTVYTADATPASLAGCSKYSRAYLQCPRPDKQPGEFLQWMEGVIARLNFSAVFPVTEITSQLLLMNTAILGDCKLPFASYDTVMSLADKGKLLQSAERIGIPVPGYQTFNHVRDVDTDGFNTFPIVVKPTVSHLWTGKEWIGTCVRIANSRRELQQILDRETWMQSGVSMQEGASMQGEASTQSAPFMIQSFIPGHGAGLFALFDSGKPVAWFSHRRIREKPPRGGVSVLSESAPVDRQLQAYAEALLTAVNWHGVAMVEFRIDPQGRPFLMEVNTRFWGSLQLAIDAGVDFPRLLWHITAGGGVTPQRDYRIGQRLRWLLGDLDSLYLACKASNYSLKEKGLRIRDFLLPLSGRSRHEVNRWDDLYPAWFELRRYLADLMLKG